MTKEEFKEGLLEKYPKELVEAAFEHAASIGLDADSLVGKNKENAEMVENVAAISFIQGFGLCANMCAPIVGELHKPKKR